MSVPLRNQFAQLLEKMSNRGVMKISIDNEVIIPTSMADINRRFMAGKYAVLPNLPYPLVKRLAHHFYVSLFYIVADCLAHQHVIDPILPMSCYKKTEEDDEIHD